MIEQDLEAALVGAIDGLGLDNCKVEGLWAAPQNGEVKLAETAEHQAYVRVKAALREFETFSSTRAQVPLKVGLAVRQEWGANAFKDFAGAIAELLQEYQLSLPAVKRDFAVSGFAPCGARLAGGEADYDEASGMYTAGWQLDVRGHVSEASETSEL